MNFAVIDDNELQRKKICNIIINKMMDNKIDFKIYEFDDYNKKLLDYIKNDKNDTVYILDLELPNGDGIDIARIIRNKYNNWISPIIIITAHSSLYYEVYKQRLQVLDFISKFQDVKNNLCENIDICLKMLNKDRFYKYIYKGIEYTINLEQIDYIQRRGRQIVIVTTSDEFYQNISINEIKKILPKYFLMSNKGTLINIKNVRKIDWNELLVYFKDNKHDYLISKTHKKELSSYE